jgi:hypothetical protein
MSGYAAQAAWLFHESRRDGHFSFQGKRLIDPGDGTYRQSDFSTSLVLQQPVCAVRETGKSGRLEGFVAGFPEGSTPVRRSWLSVNVGHAESVNSSPLKSAWPTASALASHLTRPFRIVLCFDTLPCNIRQAL